MSARELPVMDEQDIIDRQCAIISRLHVTLNLCISLASEIQAGGCPEWRLQSIVEESRKTLANTLGAMP